MLAIILLTVLFNAPSGFEDELNSFLEKNLKGYHSISFEILSKPECKSLSLSPYASLQRKNNLAYVNVDYIDKMDRSRKGVVTVRLDLFREVYVAAQDIARGEAITPDNIRKRVININHIKGEAVTGYEEIRGSVLKYDLPEGNAIVKEYLAKKPAVLHGEKINALVVNGSIIVSTEAFAREDGAPGEIIRIRTSDNKYFKAEVIDKQNVRIIE